MAPLHHLDGYQAISNEAKEERRNEGPRDCKDRDGAEVAEEVALLEGETGSKDNGR